MAAKGEDREALKIMHYDDYFVEEKELYRQTRSAVQELYISKIEQTLGGSQDTDSDPSALARQMVTEDVEVFLNAGQEQDEAYSNANSLKEEFDEIEYDRYFLLISAPTGNTSKLSFADEVDARIFQFKNFREKHYGVKHEPDVNPFHEVTCFTYNQMITEVEDFILGKAKKAKEALLIFNGHGTPHGLCLHDEPTPSNLDQFIGDVEELMRKRKVNFAGAVIPYSVQLVFAQCYGHIRDTEKTDKKDLTITSFTSSDKPQTIMTVRRRKDPILRVRVVCDSNHEELNCFAEKESENVVAESSPTGIIRNISIEELEDMDTS